MPSMMKRFSPALAPSIERPPSLVDSLLAPGAWVTSVEKSRPLGSRSICSLRMLVLRALCLTSTSGDSAVTWTLSATPATASVKSTFLIWPSVSGTSGVLAVLNPASVAVTSQIPDASDGNRYTPFASVTADTTTPFASFLTSTVTPGITAPVASLTTPSIDARCSCANAGIASASIRNASAMFLKRISCPPH